MHYKLNINQIELLLMAALGAGSDRNYDECEATAKRVAGAFADTGSITRTMVDNAATPDTNLQIELKIDTSEAQKALDEAINRLDDARVMFVNDRAFADVKHRGHNLLTISATGAGPFNKRMMLAELPE